MRDIRIDTSKTRALCLLNLLFFITLTVSAADGFYKEYSESERLVIAGAYLAVGEHYSEMGEDQKAEAYKSMADEIFPGIRSQDSPMPSAPPKTVQAVSPVRPGGKEPAAVQFYFGKMMRAVFSENMNDLESLLSTRLYLPGYDEGVGKREVLNYIRKTSDAYPLDRIDPSPYYNLNRLYIRPEGSAWTAEVELTGEGSGVFEKEFGLSMSRQKFYFREFREGWRLIAVSGE